MQRNLREHFPKLDHHHHHLLLLPPPNPALHLNRLYSLWRDLLKAPSAANCCGPICKHLARHKHVKSRCSRPTMTARLCQSEWSLILIPSPQRIWIRNPDFDLQLDLRLHLDLFALRLRASVGFGRHSARKDAHMLLIVKKFALPNLAN